MDTYYGQIRTPADAIKLFEACRLGLLPRVQRRLSEKERQSIKSGSVFVWDEREAGMRRWTDGKSWSASRVAGSFLTYREMEGKRGGGTFASIPRRSVPKSMEGDGASAEEPEADGDGPDGYRYKPDGLMKQSFSITTSTGQHLHLISYYSRPGPGTPELKQPTQDPALRHIIPVKGMYPESTVHETQAPPGARPPMHAYAASPQHHPAHLAITPNHRPAPYQYHAPASYGWPPTPAHTPPYHPNGMYQGAPPHHPAPHAYPPMSYSYHVQQTGHAPSHYQQSPPARLAALPPPNQPAHLRPLAPYQAGPPPEHAPQQSSGHAPGPQTPPRTLGMQHASASDATAYRSPTTAKALPEPVVPQQHHTLPPVRLHAAREGSAALAGPDGPKITLEASRASPPKTSPSPETDARPAPTTTNSQAASSMPSISHLMQPNGPGASTHPSRSTPPPSSATHAENVSNNSATTTTSGGGVVSNGAQNASRSSTPLSSKDGGGGLEESQKAKDIPHDRLHILGEDKRAIRVLDRKFCI